MIKSGVQVNLQHTIGVLSYVLVLSIFLCPFTSNGQIELPVRHSSWEVSSDKRNSPSEIKDSDFKLLSKSSADGKKPFNSINTSYWIQSAVTNSGQEDVEVGFTVGTHSKVKIYLCDDNCVLVAKMGELLKPHLKSIKDSEDFARFTIPAQFSGRLRAYMQSYPQYGYRKITPSLLFM